MAYMLTQAALAKEVHMQQGKGLSCVYVWLGGRRRPYLFDCPTYSDIRQQYSHLSHQASSSVATLLATDQPNVLVQLSQIHF